ncbi:MAG: hypothetical protein ABSG13_03290 [Bryobacteraceae bacterium]
MIDGDPDPAHVGKYYIEPQKLTMRMSMRRFTRPTNGFSKKIENHAASVSIHITYYNFAGTHNTPRVTPSMAAGGTDPVWELEEIVDMAR